MLSTTRTDLLRLTCAFFTYLTRNHRLLNRLHSLLSTAINPRVFSAFNRLSCHSTLTWRNKSKFRSIPAYIAYVSTDIFQRGRFQTIVKDYVATRHTNDGTLFTYPCIVRTVEDVLTTDSQLLRRPCCLSQYALKGPHFESLNTWTVLVFGLPEIGFYLQNKWPRQKEISDELIRITGKITDRLLSPVGLVLLPFSRRVVVRLIVCKECTRRIRSMGLQTRLNITDFFPAYFALKTPSVQIGQSIWIVACLLQIPSCISLLCAALYMSVFWDSQSCVTLLSYQVCIIWQQTFRGFCQKFAINGDYTWTVQWTVDPGCAEGGD